MNKNPYSEPRATVLSLEWSEEMLLTASQEGISDGGVGEDDHDPNAKNRDADTDKGPWGDLW